MEGRERQNPSAKPGRLQPPVAVGLFTPERERSSADVRPRLACAGSIPVSTKIVIGPLAPPEIWHRTGGENPGQDIRREGATSRLIQSDFTIRSLG